MANILVIDDDPIVRLFMSRVFQSFHDIQCFESLSEALEHIHHTGLDLMLIDVNLPGFGGEDIVRFLKNRVSAKIILFSALNSSALAELATRIGADGSLHKVLEAEALAEQLESFLAPVSV